MDNSASDSSLSNAREDQERAAARARFRQRIERVKAMCRIENIAARYDELRRSGSDRLVCRCLCGENADTSPSFMLWPSDDHFHCFACGRHGGVIHLVIVAERLGEVDDQRAFLDALNVLERDLVEGSDIYEQDPSRTQRRSLAPQKPPPLSPIDQQLLDVSTEWYHQRLIEYLDRQLVEVDDNGVARTSTLRQYLVDRRGLSLVTAQRLKLGYADGVSLIQHIRQSGLPVERLADIGLVNPRLVEHVRERIVFPVLRGDHTVYLIGRATRRWQDDVKYLGMPNGVVTKQPMVTGTPKRGVIFVEGAVDFAVLVQWGLDAEWLIVGLLGTASEAAVHLLLASRQLPPTAVLALDQDWAGKQAALKLARILRDRGVKSKVPVDADRHEAISAWVERMEQKPELSAREAEKLPSGQSEIETIAELTTDGFVHWVRWGNRVKDPGDLGARGAEGQAMLLQALDSMRA